VIPAGRGWGLLALCAGVASLVGGGAPLAFALAVGLGLGLLHGASDLQLVARPRWPRFLAWYLSVAVGYLLLWQVAGAVALVAFLLMSIWHFVHEDDVFAHRHEQVALGVFIVGGPAVLHAEAVGRLLDLAMGAGASAGLGAGLAEALAVGGALAAAVLALTAWWARDGRLAVTLLLIVALPPLVGFALGFFLLHAAPQTLVRQRLLGAGRLGTYVRRIWPVLLAALGFAVVAGWVFVVQEQTGIRSLFAVLAAFALPHMVVLPRFVACTPHHARA
jgi:Brp/Blh family beta-carotene 15,15'-monooxygenase